MGYKDFFKPERKKATQGHARIAAGLVATDERWSGGDGYLSRGARPRPMFGHLTDGEIDISLALLHGSDEFPPR